MAAAANPVRPRANHGQNGTRERRAVNALLSSPVGALNEVPQTG
jgi:hypothetical protein